MSSNPSETPSGAERYGPTPTSQGVRGYRDLSDAEIRLINDIKEMETDVASVWGHVANRDGVDPRWTAIARTHFQEGFSALVRSIAQPEDPFEARQED